MSFSVGNMLPRKNVQNTASILYRQKEGLMCAKCLQSVNYYTMSIVMNRPSAKTPIPESTPSTNGRGLSVFLLLLFRRRTDGAFANYPHRLGDHVVLSLRRRAVAQYEIRFLEDRAFGIADIDYSSFASFYHLTFPFTHVFDRRQCRLRYCTPFTAAVGILFYYPLIFLCVFSGTRPPGLNSCSAAK